MAKRRSSKKKDYMNKGMGMKTIIMPCVIVIIASCVFLIWWIAHRNSTYENIEYIKSFMSSSGELRDYSNKIGMHDPATDIKWYKTEDEIRIEFGRIYLTWEPADFYNENNLKQLETIGITTKIIADANGNKVLHLYYHGVELERWVK